MIGYFRRKAYEWTDEQLVDDDIVPVLYDDIVWRGGHPYIGTTNLGDARTFYFRAIGNAIESVDRLVSYAIAHGIHVIDEYLVRDGVSRRPKSMLADKLTVSTPSNVQIQHINYAKEHEPPYVLKFDLGGRQGRGIFFINEHDDIDHVIDILRERRDNEETGHAKLGAWPMLVQEYIPNDGDYRAFVLNYETISVTKRRPRPDSLVITGENTRRFKNNRWPRDIAAIAEQAARDMGVQVAGIDLVRGPNGPCVIEVNEAPMWYFCQKRTGIDIGGKIKQWLLSL